MSMAELMRMRWAVYVALTTMKESTRRVRKVKIHHVKADREIFYANCGNTAVERDSLPVSRAHLTVVEPALFE
jgi:hypothetical protein